MPEMTRWFFVIFAHLDSEVLWKTIFCCLAPSLPKVPSIDWHEATKVLEPQNERKMASMCCGKRKKWRKISNCGQIALIVI
jgi:hypothetical protein